ncbi:MAG TPA: 7-cyano-7-deazaguanine synthase QueC [Tepidisphaeraceae bacterium]|nr:7-cyano-7-deazaguanine synthase QueC [Tepidisphaeraceae bacterium]
MDRNDQAAIVLSSGGLDSTTCLAIARQRGFAPLYSMSFDYGQRHRYELEAAKRVAQQFAVAEHRVIHIDLRQFGKSALTDNIAVPKDRDESQLGSDIPITYVPARNTIFLSYALAWAEVLDVRDVFIGVNAIDYSGYPDCRPQFIAAFEAMANLATRMTTSPGAKPFKIHAPLMQMSKAQIIRTGTELGVDYSLTHSCYDPDSQGRACGRCDSCILRKNGFLAAGVADPTRYSPESTER